MKYLERITVMSSKKINSNSKLQSVHRSAPSIPSMAPVKLRQVDHVLSDLFLYHNANELHRMCSILVLTKLCLFCRKHSCIGAKCQLALVKIPMLKSLQSERSLSDSSLVTNQYCKLCKRSV